VKTFVSNFIKFGTEMWILRGGNSFMPWGKVRLSLMWVKKTHIYWKKENFLTDVLYRISCKLAQGLVADTSSLMEGCDLKTGLSSLLRKVHRKWRTLCEDLSLSLSYGALARFRVMASPGVSRQFRLHGVVLSVLRPTPSNPGGPVSYCQPAWHWNPNQ
jgi:hypothetical protein